MTAKPFLDRSSPPRLVTLILATAVGAVSMNVFLPSLPNMARYFDTEYAVVQLAVSGYLIATAVLQLFLGPASDRFGRRPVLIASFWLFIIGTVAAIFAPTIEFLLAARMLQAFSAAGMAISRAVVRDMVGPREAASRIGYITMAMAVAPMVGPLIGGLLDEIYGWQSTFLLTLAFGLVGLGFIVFDLGETNHARSSSFGAQIANYPQLLRLPAFWGYTLTATFSSGTFFAFVGGGPFVATEILHLTPSEYGFYFGVISVGYIVGSYFSGRYSVRIGINRMMLSGNIVSAAGSVASLLLFYNGFDHPLSLFGPLVLGGIGNGMTLPNANAGIVSVQPELAGSASGLGGALQIGGGAVLSILAAALLTVETGPYPLLLVMLGTMLCAILTSVVIIVMARNRTPNS